MNNYTLPFKLNNEQLKLIDIRLKEFKELNGLDNKYWFSELCFCLLTANSQAQKAIDIQKEITPQGFSDYSRDEIVKVIKKHKHRFHNTKAGYIVKARKYENIKDIVLDMINNNANTSDIRNFLIKNVKGLGYKESSHFLRNVGFSDVAIIDRHIIKFLVKFNYISHVPKVITPKVYKESEDKLKLFNIPLDRLDLMIWCHMTNKILK